MDQATYNEISQLSKSQLKQDLFVLGCLNFKENGYFVEFGAANGVDLSNTYLLEKRFNWDGILAEPAKSSHDNIRANRAVHFETKCVWKESNVSLSFNETNATDLSTIDSFSSCDEHAQTRQSGTLYQVETISLIDLLKKYNAPKHIDYLSIDTEGSEFDILENFDFDTYSFSVITCEHNYTPMRDKIYTLLTSKGYERKLTEASRWDDWYIKFA